MLTRVRSERPNLDSMLANVDTELWEELDGSIWFPLISMGENWLGKWMSSAKGYSLMVANGVDVWGEQRDTKYVEEKSQEWAVCLEAGVEELGKLILSQLQEKSAEIRVEIDDYSNRVIIQLTASLEDLPYSWLFYLSKLHGKLVEHHLTVPIATTLEFQKLRIAKLEEELRRKTRQLEEYLPSQPSKDPEQLFNTLLEASVQRVLVEGIGRTLSDRLSHSSTLLTKYKAKRIQSEGSKTSTNQPHNRPKLKKPMRGVFGGDLNPEAEMAEEAARRAQIQATTQASITPVKKKRLLNI